MSARNQSIASIVKPIYWVFFWKQKHNTNCGGAADGRLHEYQGLHLSVNEKSHRRHTEQVAVSILYKP